MITQSTDYGNCGHKIFFNSEINAYDSMSRKHNFRITDLFYNESTGVLTITQNPDVLKCTLIGDSPVTSNAKRSHKDTVEYILDFLKFLKWGYDRFDKDKHYVVYNKYADPNKKYAYFSYSENAKRWYESFLKEGDEFFNLETGIKYRIVNGLALNIIDIWIKKSQKVVDGIGTDISLAVGPGNSDAIVIEEVTSQKAGLMPSKYMNRLEGIDSEFAASLSIENISDTLSKINILDRKGKILDSVTIDRNTYLDSVEAVEEDGERIIKFNINNSDGLVNSLKLNLEKWFRLKVKNSKSIYLTLDNDTVLTADLKIDSNENNRLVLSDNGLAALIPWSGVISQQYVDFYIGDYENYSAGKYAGVIYFAIDKGLILVNGTEYGVNLDRLDTKLVQEVKLTNVPGEFEIVQSNGIRYKLAINLATQEKNGLMSADDKSKLDAVPLDYIIDIERKVENGTQALDVTSKNIYTDTEIVQTIVIENVSNEADGFMSVEQKAKLDNINNAVYDILEVEPEHNNIPTRIKFSIRDYNDLTNTDAIEYVEIPLATRDSSGLLSKEMKDKVDGIDTYIIQTSDFISVKEGLDQVVVEYNPVSRESHEHIKSFPLVDYDSHGAMRAEDKEKLDNISSYHIDISNFSSNEAGIFNTITSYNPNTTETQTKEILIENATLESNGTMSKEDKIILDLTSRTNVTNIELLSDVEEYKTGIQYTTHNSIDNSDSITEINFPVASLKLKGLLSKIDKKYIDNIPDDVVVSINSILKDGNLLVTYDSSSKVDAAISTSEVVIPNATIEHSGAMAHWDKLKLTGIEESAEVNIIESISVEGINQPRDLYRNVELDVYNKASVDRMKAEIDEHLGILDDHIVRIDENIDLVELDIHEHEVESNTRFETIEQNIDKVESNIDLIETNIDEVEQHLTNTDTILEGHLNNFDNPHRVTKEQIGLPGAEGKFVTSIGRDLSVTTGVSFLVTDKNINTEEYTSYPISIPEVSDNQYGIMSSDMFKKINTIETDADVNIVEGALIEDVQQQIDSLKNLILDIYNKNTIDTNLNQIRTDYIPWIVSGQANGVVPLNSNGKIDSTYIEGVVDLVIGLEGFLKETSELDNIDSENGDRYYVKEDKQIYTYKDGQWSFTNPIENVIYNNRGTDEYGRTNIIYRWDGLEMAEISSTLTLGEVTGTAFEGSKGKLLREEIYKHITDFTNPHKVTKTLVGLSLVDNTSDINKPVSIALQIALNELEERIQNFTNLEIDNIAAIADAAKKAADDAQAAVEGLSVGTRNLITRRHAIITGGADFPEYTGFSSVVNAKGEREVTVECVKEQDTTYLTVYRYRRIEGHLSEKVYEGWYVLSFDYKTDYDGGKFSFDWRSDSSNVAQYSVGIENTNGEWKRGWIVCDFNNDRGFDSNIFFVRLYDAKVGNYIAYRNLKLVRGTKGWDDSEAPEDVAAREEAMQDGLDGVNKELNEFKDNTENNFTTITDEILSIKEDYIRKDTLAQPNGVATLDANTIIIENQLPSRLNYWIEF